MDLFLRTALGIPYVSIIGHSHRIVFSSEGQLRDFSQFVSYLDIYDFYSMVVNQLQNRQCELCPNEKGEKSLLRQTTVISKILRT